MNFKTITEAEDANQKIGAEIQRVGRKENEEYVCTLWGDITEEDGYFCLPHHEYADKLKIKYLQ